MKFMVGEAELELSFIHNSLILSPVNHHSTIDPYSSVAVSLGMWALITQHIIIPSVLKPETYLWRGTWFVANLGRLFLYFIPVPSFWKKFNRAYATSVLSVNSHPYETLNTWTNLCETWYVYRGTWANLSGVLHKFLLSVCISVCE
jgi:hypothetical protein